MQYNAVNRIRGQGSDHRMGFVCFVVSNQEEKYGNI
jgi:hypothetical protein